MVMPRIEELGRRYKRNHPECDLSDRDAGLMLKRRHRFRYMEFMDESTEKKIVEGTNEFLEKVVTPYVEEKLARSGVESPDAFSPQRIDLPAHTPFEQSQISSLQKFYSPNAGVFSTWRKRRKSEAHTKYLVALTAEQDAMLEMGARAEEAARRSAQGRLEYQRFVAEHALILLQMKSIWTRTLAATEMGLPIEEYTRLVAKQKENEIDLDYKAGVSKIGTDETATIHSINHENITRTQQEAHELVEDTRRRLNTMYDELVQLENDPSPAAVYKLETLRTTIESTKAALYEQQSRLVQTPIGTKGARYAEASDSGGSDREEDTPAN
jgi:hypothetical protein